MTTIIHQNHVFNGILSKSMAKTLYHGTTIDKAENIAKYGLIPQTGGFTDQFYGDMYDLIEDPEERPEFEDLVFAADKEEIGRALTAMTAQIGVKLNKDMHDVTDEEIRQHGALVVIREGGWEQRPKEDPNYMWEREHDTDSLGHVEPGDYYSNSVEGISYILAGSKMMAIFRQLGVVPRKWGPDKEKNKREMLIKYVRLKHPDVPIEKIIGRIDLLSEKELDKFYESYVPE